MLNNSTICAIAKLCKYCYDNTRETFLQARELLLELPNFEISIIGALAGLLSVAILWGNQKQLKSGIPAALSCLSAVAAIAFLTVTWGKELDWQSRSPFLLGVFPATFKIDDLGRLYLILLSTIVSTVSIFSPGYINHLSGKIHAGQYWICFLLFTFSMFAVVSSADAITFLVAWELMSLASVALVAADHSHQAVQKSAFIYLGATRVASAFLCGGFLWMHALSQSWSFSDWVFTAESSYFPALLILLGVCIKAGIWPFHIWLPYAHPAAPATVSAIMSGFMIKVAVYAFIRILVLGSLNCFWLIAIVFALAAVSAFWGVLFALVQNDLKKLLAYSSIENIGLIFMAIALSLIARLHGLSEVADIAIVAAIFHSWNHGLIKSLLFLSVGSVDAHAHTRDLRDLGGLAKCMPWTMTFFFAGSFAICSIPPLNGFSSKWLLYQSLFQNVIQCSSVIEKGVSLAAICLLSAIGALAVAVFVKAMGVAFLGLARSSLASHAKEADFGMLAGQAILTTLCVALGANTDIVFRLISNSISSCGLKVDHVLSNSLPSELVAILLVGLSAFIYLVALKTSKVRTYKTWDCGFGSLSPKAQVTSDSFAQPLARIFRPFLRYENVSMIEGQDRRHFPEKVTVETRMASILEKRIYLPGLAVIAGLAKWLARLQAGSIHLYLVYVCVTLCLLLLVGMAL